MTQIQPTRYDASVPNGWHMSPRGDGSGQWEYVHTESGWRSTGKPNFAGRTPYERYVECMRRGKTAGTWKPNLHKRLDEVA